MSSHLFRHTVTEVVMVCVIQPLPLIPRCSIDSGFERTDRTMDTQLYKVQTFNLRTLPAHPPCFRRTSRGARFRANGSQSDGLGGAVHKSYHRPCAPLTRVADRTIQLSQQSDLQGLHLVP